MDIHEICDIFGGTIFYDDFRGDLKNIEVVLNCRVEERPLVVVDEVASLAILKALWHMFRGELEIACRILNFIQDPNVFTPRWRSRSLAYTSLLRLSQSCPPLFRHCISNDLSMKLFNIRHPLPELFGPLTQAVDSMGGPMSELDAVEIAAIFSELYMWTMAWPAALRLNDAIVDYTKIQHNREVDLDTVRVAQDKFMHLASGALSCGLTAMASSIFGTLAKLLHAADHEKGMRCLSAMKEICENHGDEHGLGQYWMQRGIFTISVPYTSPLVLNLALAGSSDNITGHHAMVECNNTEVTIGATATQGPQSSGDIESAQTRNFCEVIKCFDRAERHFDSSQSDRGCALVGILRACLATMEAMHPSSYWSFVPAVHPNWLQIDVGLAEAKTKCAACGDIQLSKLVLVHQLAGLTIDQDEANETTSATMIGQWAENRQNQGFALGLALFSFKLAIYGRYHLGSYQEAVMPLRVAQEILKPISIFKTLLMQVRLFQARFYESRGEQTSAVIVMNIIKNEMDQVMNDCTVPIAGSDEEDLHCDSDNTYHSEPFAILHYDNAGRTTFISMLQRTLSAAVRIDGPFRAGSQYPDRAVRRLFEILESMTDVVEGLEEWLQQQRLCLQYYSTLRKHQQLIQMCKYNDACEALDTFLKDERAKRCEDLRVRTLAIDIAVTAGKLELAADVFRAVIMDDNTLAEPCYLIGGWKDDFARVEMRRKVKLRETIFVSALRIRNWSAASNLLLELEQMSPGYFTSVSSHSELWPWQRCLYAGLVLEANGFHDTSSQYFRQALWFFIRTSEKTVDKESDRNLLEVRDYSELISALVRGSVLASKLNCARVDPASHSNDDNLLGNSHNYNQPGTLSRGPLLLGERVKEALQAGVDHNVFQLFSSSSWISMQKHPPSSQTLVWLESGRSQYVWDRNANPVESLEASAEVSIWKALSSKGKLTEKEEKEHASLGADIRNTYDQIHFTPPRNDLEDFPIESYIGSIPPRAIVVYAGLWEWGFSLLGVTNDGVKHASWDESLTLSVAQKLVSNCLSALYEDTSEPLSETFHHNCLLLSRGLLDPVERNIDESDHVIFVLSGELTRFPVGALLYKGKHLILQKQVSQIPSLSMLHFYRQQWKKTQGWNECSVACVIARPGSLVDSEKTGWKPLPMAGIEAKLVADLLGTEALDANKLSKQNFQHRLGQAQFVHISTHGVLDSEAAFNSYILLKDHFRVIDMLAVQMNVALVTFSTCLSGQGHSSNSGDVRGFSHAILAAGAQSFIGALWQIDDISTMILMYWFYFSLLKILDKPSIAHAWQFAINLVTEMDKEAIINTLEIFVAQWDHWQEKEQSPGTFVRNGRKKLNDTIFGLQSGSLKLNLSSPRFWGAFILVGNGTIFLHSLGAERWREGVGLHLGDGLKQQFELPELPEAMERLDL